MKTKSRNPVGDSKTIAGRMILIAIGLTMLYWIIESALHVFIFDEGNLIRQIFIIDPNEIWRRLLVGCILIMFGVYTQFTIIEHKRTDEALTESEDRYRDLVERAGIAILIDDEEGHFKYFNEKFAELFGYSFKETEKQSIKSLVHPEDIDRVMRYHRERLQGKKAPSRYEFRGVKKDSSTVYLEVDVVELKKGKSIIGTRSYIWDITERKQAEEELRQYREHLEELVEERTNELKSINEQLEQDITERKRAEKALRESEEKYRSLVDHSIDGICIVQGVKIEFMNQALLEMFGYKSEDQMVGHKFTEFVSPDYRKLMEERGYAREKGEKVPQRYEFKALRKDGSEFDAELSVSGIAYQGSVARQGIIRDITERKRAEEALRESETKFRTLVEQLPAITYTAALDESSTTLYVSPQIEKILGISPAAYKADPDFWVEHLHPGDRKRVLDEVSRSHESSQPFISEYRMVAEDGRLVWLRDDAVIVRDDKGNPLYLQGVMFDITERKRAEEALRESKALYRTFIDSTSDTAFIKDEQFLYLVANKACIEYFGKEEEKEIIGKSDFELMPGEPAEGCRHSDIEALESEAIVVTEELAGDRILETRKFRVRLAEDRFGIGGYVRDITESKRAEKEIRKLSQYLESIIDNANVWLDVLDEKAHVVIWNKAAEQISGYSREEVVGHGKIWEWLYPDKKYHNEITTKAAAIIDKGEVVEDFETTIRCKNGEIKTISWNSRNLLGADGKPVGSIALGRDITERKRAGEALRESEERYRIVSELTSDYVCKIKIDSENNMIMEMITDGFTRISGYKLDEVRTPKEWKKAFHPNDLEKLANFLKDIISQGRSETEVRGLTKQGEIRWLHIFGRSEWSQGEKRVCGVVLAAQDITERKRAEEALRESEHYLRKAQQIAHFGSWVLDVKTNRVEFSNEMFNIFGITKEQFVGTPEYTNNLVKPEDRARVQECYEDLLVRHKPSSTEYSIIRPDGSVRHLWGNGEVEFDETGNLQHLVGTVLDITERKRAEEALRASENKYRTLLENLPQKIFLKDKNSVYLSCNENYARDLKIKPDEIVGKTDYEFYPKELAEKYRTDDKRIMKSNETEDIEESYIQEGKEVFVHTVKTPVKDERGNVIGLLGIFWDITERKLAEEALRASEQRYRFLFEQNLAAVYRTTLDGTVLDCNESFARLLGYDSRDEVLARQASEFYSNVADREGFIERLREQGSLTNFEFCMRRKDGSPVWILENVSLIKEEEGGSPLIQGTSIDITERKRAENALRESEQFSLSLLNNSPNPMLVINPDTSVRYVNPASEKLTGFSSAEIIGKKAPYLWWTEETLKKTSRDLEKAMRKGAHNLEELFQKKNGERFWVEITSTPVKSEGKFKYYLANWVDITERKKAEEKLREANTIINRSPAVAFTWKNQEGWPVEFVSENVEKLFGYTAEEFISGKVSYADCVHPDELERVAGEVAAFSGEEGRREFVHQPYRIKTKDGLEKVLHDWTFIVRDENGKITHYKGIVQDITERKKTEEALKESEERYRSFVQNLDGIAYKGNLNFEPEFFHGCVEEITGYTGDEFMQGKIRWDSIMHKDDLPEYLELVRERIVRRPRRAESEFRIVRRDGSIRWIHETFQTIFDQSGEVIGSQGIQHDITERKRAEEALKESEERYRNLFENVPIGIYRTTPDGRILMANPAIIRMLGYSSFEELASRNLEKEGYEASYPRSQFKQLIESRGEVNGLEAAWIKSDKSVISVRENAKLFRDDKGAVLYYEGTAEDVTERKRAEEALHKSEKQASAAIEAARALTFSYDIATGKVDWGGAIEEITGYTPEEFAKVDVQGWAERIRPDDRDEILAILQEAMGKERATAEYRFRTKKGYVILSSISLTEKQDGKAVRLVGILQDITERKKAEDKLKQYQFMVESAYDAIFFKDLESRYIIVNNKTLEAFGLFREQVIGKNDYEIMPNKKEAKINLEDDQFVVKTGKLKEITKHMTGTDGKERWFQAIKVPQFDDKGNIIGLVGIARDITEKKKMEAQLIQAERLSAVGTLAYGIAHEFNNILAGILGNAEFGMGNDDPQQVAACFRIIMESCDRARGITNSLLAFSRQREAKKQRADLTEVVETVLGLTERELEKQDIKVVRKFRPIPEITCDLGELSGVVLNMITNARDAMKPEGGTLTIEIAKKKDNIEMIFTDTGCGIPDSIKSRIFEPFVTTKGALGQSDIPGTGLGLFLSYGIINRYQGEIAVKSEKGKGSKFAIKIPISKNRKSPVLFEPEEEKEAPVPQNLNILLVDDEKPICTAIKKFFEAKGHSVTTALSGKKGLNTFKKGSFDLVLADITMPDMDGVELISELKKIDQKVKFIVLTGHIAEDKLDSAKKAGADQILMKPFRNEELYQVIGRILRI